jgi:AraC family transcriptional regulator
MLDHEPTAGFFGMPVLEWRSGSTFVAEHLYRPHQRIERHQHDHPYICVVLSGGYLERSDHGERECRSGSVLIHPAGSRHSDRFGRREARLLMVEIAQDPQRLPFSEPQMFDSGPAWGIGLRLHQEASCVDDVTPLAIEGLTLELMAFAHRDRIRRSGRPPEWLRLARERIDDELPLRIPACELATAAGVHPAHFSRVFRAHFGGTVADYVRRRRVGIAKEAIADGRTLAEAALDAGFADQSDLTRAFRRILGITPTQFRCLL